MAIEISLDRIWLDAVALLPELAVKASILLLLGHLATRCWRASSAAVRHWVWVTVFGALLALPLVATWAPDWRLPLPISAQQTAAAPPAGVDTQLPSARSFGAAEEGPPMAVPLERGRVEAAALLLGGWVAGAGAVLLLLVGTHLRRVVEVGRGRSLRRGRAVSVLQGLCRRVGLVRVPRLVETAAGSMPTTSGIVRPVIGFPAGAADTWPEDRLEGVLLHELAHIRRRDLLVQLLAQVACALHWYNPLVWGALRRLRLESEMACDDLVVASGVRASSYGDLLIRLAREQRRSPLPPLAWIPVAEKSQLPVRLRALLDPSRRHGCASPRLVGGILVAAAALATAVATAAVTARTATASEAPGPITSATPSSPAEGVRPPASGGGGEAQAEPAPIPALRARGTAADTVPPALLNRTAVAEAIRDSYPPALRQRGVSGTALLELDVDPSGGVAAIRVLNASDPAFAGAASEALRAARFRPARTEDGPVGMSVHWPVAYNALDGGPEDAAIATAFEEARILQEMQLGELQRQARSAERASEEAALRTALLEREAEVARLRAVADTIRGASEQNGVRTRLREQQAELARMQAMAETVLAARLAEQQAELTRLHATAETARERADETGLRTLLTEQRAELERLRASASSPDESAALQREREAALKAIEILEARLQAEGAPVGPAPRSQRQGRVVGDVVDAGGNPIAGAVVRVSGRDGGATTDPDGRFAIFALPPGRYTLEVSVPNTARSASATVSLTAGETTTARITVSSSGDR
jgi:TonB family protein